jgi:GT2 family glycosyltransferase
MALNSFPPANCDLSIIIVNWNTRKLLAQCLDSLFLAPQWIDLEVIVLDSASDDGSAAMVQQQFPQVRLIESEKNLGFAGGNNLALRQARGRHILLLNPDTIVHDNALIDLYDTLEKYPALGVVGAQLLNTDSSLQQSWGIFPSLRTEIPLLNRLSRMKHQPALGTHLDDKSTLLPVDWVSGACLMSKRDVFEQIGLLDEDFWLYTEEADFCFRAQAVGWKVASLPQARISHVARAASRQKFTETMLYFYQSRIRFISKHQGAFQAKIAKRILAIKARLWRQEPYRSPLYLAYGSDLTEEQIRTAYRRLIKVMSMPLEALLSTRWH